MPPGYKSSFKEVLINTINKSKYHYVSGEYFKIKSNNLIVKDDFNYYYKTSIDAIRFSINYNGNLEYISKSNPFSIKNLKNWIKLHNKNFKFVGGEYKHAHERNLQLKCRVCNEKWTTNWAHISGGEGCPYCSGKKVREKNSFGGVCPMLLEEWDYINNVVNPFEVTPHSGKRIFWICKKCNNHWVATINKRSGGNGCPKCFASKGEKCVENFLDKNNVCYIREYSFEDCKFIAPLYFDFYILNKNILIEFQGMQHYFPVDFCGYGKIYANKEFEKNKLRDNIKKQYCTNNNIRLLEIPYWEINNVDSILTKEILEYANVS